MMTVRFRLCPFLTRNAISARIFPITTTSPNFSHFRVSSEPNKIKLNCYSTTATFDSDSKGIFSKVFGRFQNSKSNLRATSVLLYESILEQIKYTEFFEEFEMPDTFNSWFLVTEIHCHMLLTRVMNEGPEAKEDGRFMRNAVVETLWNDVQNRSKKLSQDNPSAARRQVQVLSEQFQAALIAYDEGVLSDDKILANALWRRFFEMSCSDYSKLEKLIIYVRKTMSMLDGLTRDELVRGRKIKWLSLKDI